MAPVRLTPEAEQDLEQIGDYIALDNSRRAVAFIDELLRTCLAIDRTPEGFPLQLTSGRRSDVRCMGAI